MLPEKIHRKAKRVLALTAAGAMIAAIAVADWRTSPYVSLGFLYLFPIMLVAGYLPRWALALLSVLCAILSEIFSALDPEGRIIRLIFATVAFAGFGMFVHELLRNRRLAMETQARLLT